jgi:hypothetical protein
MGIAALHPSYGSNHPRRPPLVSLHFFPLALFAFAKALRDRRSPGDQRGLVRQALREVGVIMLHDIKHGFLGKPSMVFGKEFVKVSELFVVHGFRASVAIPVNIPQPVDPVPAFDAIGYLAGANWMVIPAPRRRNRRLAACALTIC